LYAFIVFPVRVRLFPIDTVPLNVLWSSSLCHYLQPPVASSGTASSHKSEKWTHNFKYILHLSEDEGKQCF
jgi:hypothetical protein